MIKLYRKKENPWQEFFANKFSKINLSAKKSNLEEFELRINTVISDFELNINEESKKECKKTLGEEKHNYIPKLINKYNNSSNRIGLNDPFKSQLKLKLKKNKMKYKLFRQHEHNSNNEHSEHTSNISNNIQNFHNSKISKSKVTFDKLSLQNVIKFNDNDNNDNNDNNNYTQRTLNIGKAVSSPSKKLTANIKRSTNKGNIFGSTNETTFSKIINKLKINKVKNISLLTNTNNTNTDSLNSQGLISGSLVTDSTHINSGNFLMTTRSIGKYNKYKLITKHITYINYFLIL